MCTARQSKGATWPTPSFRRTRLPCGHAAHTGLPGTGVCLDANRELTAAAHRGANKSSDGGRVPIQTSVADFHLNVCGDAVWPCRGGDDGRRLRLPTSPASSEALEGPAEAAHRRLPHVLALAGRRSRPAAAARPLPFATRLSARPPTRAPVVWPDVWPRSGGRRPGVAR